MITQTTDFINEWQVSLGEFNTLQLAINKYEPEIIRLVFGYELGKLIINYDEDTSEQRIKDVVEGKEYSIDYNNRTQLTNWDGIKTILVPYIYAKYMRDTTNISTPVGLIHEKTENANRIDVYNKVAYGFFIASLNVGSELDNEIEPTLYNFLKANEADYPELIFNTFNAPNAFDL